MLEFVHLGRIFDDRTLLEGVHRVPFDGWLGRRTSGQFSRFVYEPRTFDYVDELADRIQRAVDRRIAHAGRTGLLLDGSYGARTILACHPKIEECYTTGQANDPEAGVAQVMAERRGVSHTTVETADCRPYTDAHEAQYGHGSRESLRVCHEYDSRIDVDTIYHGLLCDVLLGGRSLPRNDIEVLGRTLTRDGLDPDPDPLESLAGTFGFAQSSDRIFAASDAIGADTATEFAQDVIESQLATQADRYDSIYDGIDLLAIRNSPSISERMYLADRYLESLVAADTELLDWHLHTPPEHRNPGTFVEAIERIDERVLGRRPHGGTALQQVRHFLEHKFPAVSATETAVPDQREQFDREDGELMSFPNCPEVDHFPPRVKLRIHDAVEWLATSTDELNVTPLEVLHPL